MPDPTELSALAAQATPEPWDTGYFDGEIVVRDEKGNVVAVVGDEMNQTEHDAAFIAAARTAVPQLCAEVAALQAKLERYTRALKNIDWQREYPEMRSISRETAQVLEEASHE